MTVCAACGTENPQGAKFCNECGAALAATPPAREQRKTVTVLFCDVTGSTALGESVDPEALRALLARYFERMKAIVERHGGTVEKFIGDAVMAVFGVPVVREDDALRAVRAAAEMRDALPELRLQARIGINTGEVVTGTEERLATGDAVNVAARLEQAAAPGEILLGEPTRALVGEAVDAEPVEPLAVKGKSEPVPAFRLRSLRGAVERRFTAPMVGRETELERLRSAFRQALRDRSCQLFTVLGSAGVGKSRLVAEFAAGLDARVVVGRCVSYGEGITYWPVVEVVKQLDALPVDPAAATAIRSLLGESEQASSGEEIAWGFRRLLEEQAQERPLVCVFDDLHWGEETFLELVEHVADLARDAPLLLLCMARPELLERRPAWGGGKLNATTVLLEPLDAAESERLLEELGGVEGELRERIRAAAEGNPLFLEEMLALVRESGAREVSVPPTIQALLAARLDQLHPGERAVLERGSVEGRVFHRSAVAALSDTDGELSQRLVSLVRKELVRPDRAQLAGDDAYRFRHLLIRDAAYDAVPKSVRAQLHERFAAWLEAHGADLVELDEVLGYHLEQAARYRAELGQPDAALAERAGERLAAAGSRVLWRGDDRAAAALLERALVLLRPLRVDVGLELELGLAQRDVRRRAAIAERVAERAREEGDQVGEAVARLEAVNAKALFGAASFEELERVARGALPLLEEAADHSGLVHVWNVITGLANLRGQYEEMAYAAERATYHARAAGQPRTRLFGLPLALHIGPRPADDALRTLDALLPENPHPSPVLERAVLLAMLGRFEEAWPLARDATRRWRELTGEPWGEDRLANIATFEGDHERAAESLRVSCELFERRGLRAVLSTYAPARGLSLCALGRYDEAEPLAKLGRELGDEQDVATQSLWRMVQALVDASRGELERAERLAREAVAISQRTDQLIAQGGALSALAEVLHAADRTDEAIAALEQALERYERKKNLAMAHQVRERLASLGDRSAARPR